jgi:hypothetical protein
MILNEKRTKEGFADFSVHKENRSSGVPLGTRQNKNYEVICWNYDIGTIMLYLRKEPRSTIHVRLH